MVSNSTYVVQLEVQGDSGHGSRPEAIDRHAIYAAFATLNDIQVILPRQSQLEVQKISTGGKNSSNQFPQACMLHFSVSNLDNEARRQLDQHIAGLQRVSRI